MDVLSVSAHLASFLVSRPDKHFLLPTNCKNCSLYVNSDQRNTVPDVHISHLKYIFGQSRLVSNLYSLVSMVTACVCVCVWRDGWEQGVNAHSRKQKVHLFIVSPHRVSHPVKHASFDCWHKEAARPLPADFSYRTLKKPERSTSWVSSGVVIPNPCSDFTRCTSATGRSKVTGSGASRRYDGYVN